MSAGSQNQNAIRYMLLGMLTTLVVVGVVWSVVHSAGGDNAPTPAVTPEGDKVVEVEAEDPPAKIDDVESPEADALQKQAEASAAQLAKKVAEASAAADVGEAAGGEGKKELTAEEREAKREEMRQKEIAFMEDSFDDMKPRLMEIVDAYLDKPVDERPGYLGRAMRDYFGYYFQQRKAAGLTGMPPLSSKDDWLDIAKERMTDEEKEKFTTFTDDITKMQVARVQAMQKMMNSRLKTETPAPTPEAPGEPRLR